MVGDGVFEGLRVVAHWFCCWVVVCLVGAIGWMVVFFKGLVFGFLVLGWFGICVGACCV